MFQQQKKQNQPGEEKLKNNVEILTFLGVGTEFKGRVIFQGTIRIDGIVEGEVEGNDTLILGESGAITGTCKVATAVVSGKFKGDLFATDKVTLKNTADINGKIITPALIIEDGANFNGNCKMGKDALTETGVSGKTDESSHLVKI